MINTIKELNGEPLGIIVALDGRVIVVETDFIHHIQNPDDGIYIGDDESGAVYCTVSESKASLVPILISDFGHYWGINHRVRQNYSLLLKTMRELGIDTSAMPRWGDVDKVTP